MLILWIPRQVLRKGNLLKGSNIHISEDISKRVRESRFLHIECFSCSVTNIVVFVAVFQKKLFHKNSNASVRLVDCPTQLTLITWICQLYYMTNTSEKYEGPQQGNLLVWGLMSSSQQEWAEEVYEEDKEVWSNCSVLHPSKTMKNKEKNEDQFEYEHNNNVHENNGNDISSSSTTSCTSTTRSLSSTISRAR